MSVLARIGQYSKHLVADAAAAFTIPSRGGCEAIKMAQQLETWIFIFYLRVPRHASCKQNWIHYRRARDGRVYWNAMPHQYLAARDECCGIFVRLTRWVSYDRLWNDRYFDVYLGGCLEMFDIFWEIDPIDCLLYILNIIIITLNIIIFYLNILFKFGHKYTISTMLTRTQFKTFDLIELDSWNSEHSPMCDCGALI